MQKQNILVFPSGTEIANEIIGALKNNKAYNLIFASSADIDYSSFLSYERYYLPYVSDDEFLEELNALIRDKEVDYIIPAHDDAAYYLSKLEGLLCAKVIGQNFEINEVVRFKDKTYDIFKGILPIAQIFDNQLPSESDFPVFVKPKKGQGSFDAVRLNNLTELDSFFDTRVIEDYVIMECLTGDEFTIDCFSDRGNLIYSGARTREKVTKGISVLSSLVTDKFLKNEFQDYASRISSHLGMHGLWFFQMKFNKDGQLRLLEVASRVSGTMMLNRVLGVNFLELAILQKQGYLDLEIAFNNIQLSLARALVPVYKHDIVYENLYIDFDDTLFLNEKTINAELMRLIFEAKNENKFVYLLTKNKKNNLASVLNKFGISSVFDNIYHLREDEKKTDFMRPYSVLVDDSFTERKNAIAAGHIAFGVDNFSVLFFN